MEPSPKYHWLRVLVFALIAKPAVKILIGLNVRQRVELPTHGPAILIANHNSHLDTMVLMSLFPLKALKHLRPVAAADYFLKNKLIAWFSTHIIGIIPIERKDRASRETNPLEAISKAIQQNKIVLFFPEGTRGEPEVLAKFKKGIARLAELHPKVPIYPLFFHGLGKALPRGEGIFVPFFCDVVMGHPIFWNGGTNEFMDQVEGTLASLGAEVEKISFEEFNLVGRQSRQD